MNAFRDWLAANHLSVLFSGFVLYVFPALLALILKPEPGTKLAGILGILSAWGFDAEKFGRKVRETLAAIATEKPRGMAGLRPVLGVAVIAVGVAAGPHAGCAWLRSSALPILDVASEACATGQAAVLSLLTSDGMARALCLTEQAIDILMHELLAAKSEGREAVVRVRGADGAVQEIHVAVADLEHGLAEAKRAKMSLRGGK